MNEKYILHGPEPLIPIPEDSLGVQFFECLFKNKHLPNALVDAATGEKVSYTKILEKTCLLANSLQNYGIKENDVIGIFSENNLEYFYPIIAGLYLGTVVTTFNPSYTVRELLHATNISKPKIIFCSELTLSTALQANLRCKIIILDQKQNISNIKCLDEFISNTCIKTFSIKDFKPASPSKEQVALILYSSGTTGLPKGVMITHKNVITRCAIASDPRYYNNIEAGSGCALGLLPFYHTFGLFVIVFNLLLGKTVVVMKKFQEELFLKVIQDHKITNLYLVPPLALFLAKSPLINKYDLSSLVEVGCGAAPLSKETQEIVIKRLNLKLFRQAYGLTETTLGVVATPLAKIKEGSVGTVFPYTSAKVVDIETGRLLGPNQSGELCFKGDLIMKGYAGDEEATKNAFDKDGWLCTGDVGYYDEDGYFYIVDRLKELIKYKGFQVPPAELEAILLTHPKIKDAGVVGVPDELAGELPMAFVVKQDNADLTEDEIKTFVAKQVSPQKRLRGGIRFVNDIPRNPSGKILRRKLRELIQKQKSKL